ncbi:MAG: ribonuclease E/G [Pseudomonadota bacterium]
MTQARNETKQLIIECGVAQTRAALIKNDRIEKFWFGPARGDEHLDQTPRAGRRYIGRVKSISSSLNAAFVDLGDGRDAYLALNKKIEPHICDGALIGAAVKSPPRQDKGAVVKYRSDIDLERDTPGRCPPFADAAMDAVTMIGGGSGMILTDDGAAAALLKSKDAKTDIRHEAHASALFESFGAEQALEEAFDRCAPLEGGGRLIIDEAQAVTAIDVDTAGLTASSPERLREKIALSAACEAAHQIILRNLGGHIVIDFPALKGDASRKRFNENLRIAMSTIDGAGAFSFSKSGLFSMTVPHHMQSLMERFTEDSGEYPAPGRRFTVDWQAQSAIRKLEHHLRAAPAARFLLRLGEALDAYISDRGEWLERLRDRFGARFDLVADEIMMERSFELSEQ